jgi:nucleoid-associated protein YgaU
VLLVALLALVVVAHHPLARALGTESSDSTAVGVAGAPLLPFTVATPPAAPVAATPRPVARHAPVDPFRSLVTTSGQLQARQYLPSRHGRAANTRHHAAGATATPSSAGCPSSVVVTAGQSLWSIAASHHLGDVKKGGRASASSSGWQALYDANRQAVGGNPDVLHVGTRLCLPG